ncbi:toxin-antitoxin system, toxin component, PIN family [Leptospira inadai serovar Lyme str. 10]|uniref:Toxin-antitoxin system, toxin component, PIN family n=1 Tax=Leptospira inadai serovar Lyme str. 10 TaxID=1049790 RepID=V6HGZ2_9LEPT|nr:toxin-antitoxin system, toxin component, PIN family [Leptospira inadai serovar Lyme str. 10]
MHKEKNRISLIEFLSIFEILPFEQSDAQAFGIIKADLKKSGNLIGSIDALLTAQALSRDFIFVTNNTKEFKRVRNLNLNLEDWSL